MNEYHEKMPEVIDSRRNERGSWNDPQRFNKGNRSEQVAAIAWNEGASMILRGENTRNGGTGANEKCRGVNKS